MGAGNPWFRYYVEALDDFKVQRLPDALFKAWVNLLCVAAKYGGKIPSVSVAAYGLRMDEEQAMVIVRQLNAAGLLDAVVGGYYEPHNWEGRQYKHDSSTERVREHRSRKMASARSEDPDETASSKPDETVSRNSVKRFRETDQSRADQSTAEQTRAKRDAHADADVDADARVPAPGKRPSESDQRLRTLAVLPRLLAEFIEAMPARKGGHPKKATAAAFRAAILDGEEASAIIEAARAYNAEAMRNGEIASATVMAADAWLIGRPWLRNGPARTQTAAHLLAKTIASLAGRDEEFDEWGWGDAAKRVQEWFDAGWSEGNILAAVREMAARRSGPVSSIRYFEQGIAELIARQSPPLPFVAGLPATKANGQRPANNVVAAADHLIERMRGLQES